MTDAILSAVIGCLVGAIFGGATTVLVGIRPMARELHAFQTSTTADLAVLRSEAQTTAARIIGLETTTAQLLQTLIRTVGGRNHSSED